jgi:uncharacterized protein (DUF1684 family)
MATVQEWRAAKERELLEPYGWLSLAGIHYPKEGKPVTVVATGELALPRGPAVVGTLARTGSKVALETEGATHVLQMDKPVILPSGVSLTLLLRFGREVVRVRDPEARAKFGGFRWFAESHAWRIVGRWVAGELRVAVGTERGDAEETVFAGHVAFEAGGDSFRLFAEVTDDKSLFIVFRDSTAKTGETYGAGRFLNADAPDEEGRVVLDFNRAFNPACYYSPYALCPLPIKENRLPIRVEAGQQA